MFPFPYISVGELTTLNKIENCATMNPSISIADRWSAFESCLDVMLNEQVRLTTALYACYQDARDRIIIAAQKEQLHEVPDLWTCLNCQMESMQHTAMDRHTVRLLDCSRCTLFLKTHTITLFDGSKPRYYLCEYDSLARYRKNKPNGCTICSLVEARSAVEEPLLARMRALFDRRALYMEWFCTSVDLPEVRSDEPAFPYHHGYVCRASARRCPWCFGRSRNQAVQEQRQLDLPFDGFTKDTIYRLFPGTAMPS
jgi:7-cyano-7-deazaguanine synthase in queuosine biosynthesis